MNSIARTNLKTALCSALLAAGIAGCMVGPNYKQPTSELKPFNNLTGASVATRPAAPTTQPNIAATRPVPPLEKWWVGFNDPTLVTIVQRALDQNLDLASALARVEQARAAVSGASAQLLPTVDLNGSASTAHQSLNSQLGTISRGTPGYRRDFHEYYAGPAASWEIDLFGGLRRAEAASQDELQAAIGDQIGTRVIVASEAADAYFQIRGYQARLAVAQSQIDTDEHLLKLVQARYQAGAAQGREIAQADALLKQARAYVPPLRISLEEQMNRLDVLMGEQPGTYSHELRAESSIASIPAIPGDEQPCDLLRRRPDIIAAERRLAASNERIGAAISDYYPKISLVGALGLDSVNANHLFTSNAFQAAGQGALRWRIFDFGKINAEVAQARGANAEALADYRQSVLRGVEDVENSLFSLTQTQVHVAELQDQVDALKKSRDLSVQEYRAGSITLTDVLDADRLLLTAQDQLHANRADAARAAVGVFQALGGGWDPQVTR